MACHQLRNSWKCTLCGAIYCSLTTLVSHIRASHSHTAGLSFQCGINSCNQTFHNTTTFYKHVRRNHSNEYSKVVITGPPPLIDSTIVSGDDQDGAQSMECDLAATPDDNTSTCNGVDVEDVACGCLLKLRCKPGVTEVLLNEIVESIQTVVNGVLLNVEADIREHFPSSNSDNNNNIMKAVLSILNNASDPLSNLTTSYRLKSVTQAKYPTVEPIRFKIGSHIVNKDGFTDVPDEIVYVPFLKNLECILQNDGIRSQVLSSPHKLSPTYLGDICDGQLFKEHPIFGSDPNALQIIAYFDEVELANPLGSKAKYNKIGAIYFTLANIDPAQRSSLDAINLIPLFRCNLLDTYSIDGILEPFFEDVKKPSALNGYGFNIKGVKQVLHGALVAFLGDTPAVSKVAGFKEGVGFAHRKCRHCMANDLQIQEKFIQEDFTVRTKEMHKIHCSRIENQSASTSEKEHYSICYGINCENKLAKLEHFDVTNQLPQDIMHVLLEGIAPTHIGLLLKNVLLDNPICTPREFNHRLQCYPYQYFETATKPSPISDLTLSKCDMSGKQSAAQMRSLVHVLPLLIGDKLKETHEEHLDCFLQLHDLIATLMTPTLIAEQIPYLKICIADYLKSFVTLYRRNLTPKFHFLVHIPNQIKRLGPPVRLWCMCMEAKHKQIKNWAGYKNLCLTLVNRHQQYASYVLSSSHFSSISSVVNFTGAKNISPSDLTHTLRSAIVTILGSRLDESNLYRCLSVTIHGTVYRRDCWLLIGKREVCGIPQPMFGKVVDVFQYSSTPYLAISLAANYSTKHIEHLRSYEVSSTDQIKLIHPSTLLFHEPLSVVECELSDSMFHVKSRIDLYAFLNFTIISLNRTQYNIRS